MTDKLKVTVVGAGIGGLTAAIALRQRGYEVTLLEQAGELGEIGAGVQLSPNAMKVMRALGIEKEVIGVAFEPNRHLVRSWRSGRLLAATELKSALRKTYDAGYYGFHRADLHRVLQAAVPGGVVRLGAKVASLEQDANSATVTLEGGERIRADVVIGADGVHSAVRASLYGVAAPRFTGNVCWRGVVDATKVTPGAISPDMTVWFGPGASFIFYYVRGGKLVNWVAMCEAPSWKSEVWKYETDGEELLQRYRRWHPLVRELIGKTDRYLKWALLDRDPLPHWSQGRATLLGDAAHPMLPYLAQGACMAIEDGYSVAASLSRSPGDVPAALRDYEERRRERTARVQMLARARSIENHLSSPLAQLKRNIRYALERFADPAKHTYKIEWIYGHDVTV